MNFIEKFTEKWYAATQVEEITRQFGGWVLCKNKAGYWLISENYTQGVPNIGVWVPEKDVQEIEAAFQNGDNETLHNFFEVAYTSFQS